MDGITMMLVQLIQGLGIDPQELMKKVDDFKNIGDDVINRLNRIEEKQDLIINHFNIKSENNTGEIKLLNGVEDAESTD